MIIRVIRVLGPITQSELLQLWHEHLILYILKIQILFEANFIEFALLISLMQAIRVIALGHYTGETGWLRKNLVRVRKGVRLEQRLPFLLVN